MRQQTAVRVTDRAAEVVRAQLLGAVCEAAMAALAARASSVALLDAPARELVFAAAAGERAGDLVGGRFKATEGLAGAVLSEGRPLAADDLLAETRFAHDIAEETGYVPDCMLVAPIPGPAGPAGVLSVLDPEAGGDDRLDRLAAFADQAAAAVAVDGSARAMLSALRELLA